MSGTGWLNMHPVLGQVSTRARRTRSSTSTRRSKVKLTKDDVNIIMDGIPEEGKGISVVEDEKDGVILDVGDFLVVFANAVLGYKRYTGFKAMKGDVQ
jgi:hypothetical protein